MISDIIELFKFGKSYLANKVARKRFMGFRPVVSCLLRSNLKGEYKFLMVRPFNDPDIWILPQEGIELGESFEAAVVRCLNDELTIAPTNFHYRRSFYAGSRVFEKSRHGERDLDGSFFKMKGKCYIGSLVNMQENVDITLNINEVIEYEWVNIEILHDRVNQLESSKKNVLQSIIQNLSNSK